MRDSRAFENSGARGTLLPRFGLINGHEDERFGTARAGHRTWLRDQYHHPEEHRHTLKEVRRWFAEADIDYVRAVPGALVGEGNEYHALTDPEVGGWWLEDVASQLGWIRQVGSEGGLFVTVGRARGRT